MQVEEIKLGSTIVRFFYSCTNAKEGNIRCFENTLSFILENIADDDFAKVA